MYSRQTLYGEVLKAIEKNSLDQYVFQKYINACSIKAEYIQGTLFSTRNFDTTDINLATDNYMFLYKQFMLIKEGNTTKMALGYTTDHNGISTPMLCLGGQNAEGDNIGYITKSFSAAPGNSYSLLNMFLVADRSANEIAYLSLGKKNGVMGLYGNFSSITLDEGYAGELLIDSALINSKLEMTNNTAQTISLTHILKNTSNSLAIPKENLKNSDVTYWDAKESTAGAQTKADAAYALALSESKTYAELKKTELKDMLNLTADLPTEVTMDANGIKAVVTGDPTKYVKINGSGLLIENGAIAIKSTNGTTFLNGSGIDASYITAGSMDVARLTAGTLTAFYLKTATTGARTEILANGIQSYGSNGLKKGLWTNPNYGDLYCYAALTGEDPGDETSLFTVYNTGMASTTFSGWKSKWAEQEHDTFYPYGVWDFTNCTPTNFAPCVWG